MASPLQRASTARFPKSRKGVPQPLALERGSSHGSLLEKTGTPRAGRRRGRPLKRPLGDEDTEKVEKCFKDILDQQRSEGLDVEVEAEDGGGEGISLFGLVKLLRHLGHDRTSQQVQGLCALENLRPLDTSMEAVAEMRVPLRVAVEVTARCASDPPLDEFEMMSALAVLAPGNKPATLAMMDHGRIRQLMTSFALPLKEDEMDELAAEMGLKPGGQSPVSSLVEVIHRAANSASGDASAGRGRRATLTAHSRAGSGSGSGSGSPRAGAAVRTGSSGSPLGKAAGGLAVGSSGSPLARRGTSGSVPQRKTGARG